MSSTVLFLLGVLAGAVLADLITFLFLRKVFRRRVNFTEFEDE